MAKRFFDLRIAFTSPSTGDTGQIEVGSRLGPSFKLPAETGIANGDKPLFLCQQDDDWMEVEASWNSGAGALDIVAVRRSWIAQEEGTARLNLSAGSQWRCLSPDMEDLERLVVRTDISQAASLTPADRAQVLANIGIGDIDLQLALLQMAAADALNVAQFSGNSGNRFADSFDALGYVDTGAATNLSTSTASALKPTVVPDTFAGAYDPTLTGNSTGFGGVMDRFVIAAAAFSTSGDRVRLTVTPPTTGNNTNIAHAFIGPKGASAPNFDGTQVRVTFGGNNGVTLVAGGASVVSDEVAIAFDHTKDYVVAFEFTGTTDQRGIFGGASNVTRHEKVGSGESGTTNVSGYSSNAGYVAVLDKIEVRTATGYTNNMEVASNSLTAATAPTSAKLVARVYETQAIALNADLIFSASRNGGANFLAFTMTKKFSVGSLAVYESNDLDISGLPSGASMKWKVASANNKMFEMRDIYFHWN
jgi:hypothetical protein